jgi:hypothetical protein
VVYSYLRLADSRYGYLRQTLVTVTCLWTLVTVTYGRLSLRLLTADSRYGYLQQTLVTYHVVCSYYLALVLLPPRQTSRKAALRGACLEGGPGTTCQLDRDASHRYRGVRGGDDGGIPESVHQPDNTDKEQQYTNG